MIKRVYKGLPLKLVQKSPEIWEVELKKQKLRAPLAPLCKSIDWWQQTAQLIDPKNFATLHKEPVQATGETRQENYNGYVLRNDTGDINGWYCMFHGKLLKGGKGKIQQFIDAKRPQSVAR